MSKPWDTDLSIYGDEAALLEGLRRRDRFACSCMLKHYAPRLYRLTLRLTRDPDVAEDVLQEAFIRGCERIDEFKGLSSLGSWLHRIVVNTALMHLRAAEGRRVVHAAGPDDDQPSPLDTLADTSGEPGAEFISAELRAHIEHAVLALPDTLRTAFVLRELEGMTTAEAAEALGITEAALKVRLHRARAALRASLAPYLDDTGAPHTVEAR